MPSGNERYRLEHHPGANRWFLLAGLQAGIVGALILIGWLALSSAWYRRSVWMVPNLLSSTFYGEPAFRSGFRLTTFAGLALLLFIYGILGALFGLVIRDNHSRAGVILLGFLFGTGWYFISFGLLWKHWNPLVMLYSPDRAMLVGHVLYGGVLGRLPVYLRAMHAAGGAPG